MVSKFATTNSLLALALALGLSAAPAAFAQNAGPGAAPPQAAQRQAPHIDPASIPADHLKTFADINVQARDIQKKHKKEIDSAKTMEDINAVQRKMMSELVDTIQANDLSVQEYRRITEAVQQNPSLRSKVITMISQRMGKEK